MTKKDPRKLLELVGHDEVAAVKAYRRDTGDASFEDGDRIGIQNDLIIRPESDFSAEPFVAVGGAALEVPDTDRAVVVDGERVGFDKSSPQLAS